MWLSSDGAQRKWVGVSQVQMQCVHFKRMNGRKLDAPEDENAIHLLHQRQTAEGKKLNREIEMEADWL